MHRSFSLIILYASNSIVIHSFIHTCCIQKLLDLDTFFLSFATHSFCNLIILLCASIRNIAPTLQSSIKLQPYWLLLLLCWIFHIDRFSRKMVVVRSRKELFAIVGSQDLNCGSCRCLFRLGARCWDLLWRVFFIPENCFCNSVITMFLS